MCVLGLGLDLEGSALDLGLVLLVITYIHSYIYTYIHTYIHTYNKIRVHLHNSQRIIR